MNIKDLENQDPKEILQSIEQEDLITPQTNGITMEIPPQDPSLDEYDIISSSSSASGKMNGHHGHDNNNDPATIEIKTADFNVLKEQPRYVISKGKISYSNNPIFVPSILILEAGNFVSVLLLFIRFYKQIQKGVYKLLNSFLSINEYMCISKNMSPTITGYTAKRKDEVHLPLGTEITVTQKKNDRSYVVAFTKKNTELDRGWLPSYCLTLKTEATDINSKEGITLTNFCLASCEVTVVNCCVIVVLLL